MKQFSVSRFKWIFNLAKHCDTVKRSYITNNWRCNSIFNVNEKRKTKTSQENVNYLHGFKAGHTQHGYFQSEKFCKSNRPLATTKNITIYVNVNSKLKIANTYSIYI